MSERNYLKFRTPCDVSETSIIDAVFYVGPAFVYEMRVHIDGLLYTRKLLRQINLSTKRNALTPHINLVVDPTYRRDEWSLHANGLGMGSPGAI